MTTTFMEEFQAGRIDGDSLYSYMLQWWAAGNRPGGAGVRLAAYLGFSEQQWLDYLDNDRLPERGAA